MGDKEAADDEAQAHLVETASRLQGLLGEADETEPERKPPDPHSRYHSAYFDAHSASLRRLVAALEQLREKVGLPEVRSALRGMIDDAHNAEQALRSDRGELQRLHTAVESLRDRREQARAVVMELMLAFREEQRGAGVRAQQRRQEQAAAAKAAMERNLEEQRQKNADSMAVQAEEVKLLHTQLEAARAEQNSTLSSLEGLLETERELRRTEQQRSEQERVEERRMRRALEERLQEAEKQLKRLSADFEDQERRKMDEMKSLMEEKRRATAAAHAAWAVSARHVEAPLRLRSCFTAWRVDASRERDVRELSGNYRDAAKDARRVADKELMRSLEEGRVLRERAVRAENELERRDKLTQQAATTWHFAPVRGSSWQAMQGPELRAAAESSERRAEDAAAASQKMRHSWDTDRRQQTRHTWMPPPVSDADPWAFARRL